MAYSGTSITSGSGKGVVVAIGEHTEIGKINTAMHQMDSTITPLMQQTSQFGKRVSVAIVVLSILYLYLVSSFVITISLTYFCLLSH